MAEQQLPMKFSWITCIDQGTGRFLTKDKKYIVLGVCPNTDLVTVTNDEGDTDQFSLWRFQW